VIKSFATTLCLISLLAFVTTTDARYYKEIEYPEKTSDCKCIQPGCRIVKLGMTKGQVGSICGRPVRRYPLRYLYERWDLWGYNRKPTYAAHQKYLFRHKKWKKAKIFHFRNQRLYEIYDYGTPTRWPKLPE